MVPEVQNVSREGHGFSPNSLDVELECFKRGAGFELNFGLDFNRV